MKSLVIFVIFCLIAVIAAQDGPAPPRLSIPGAVLIPAKFRPDRIGPVRVRKPILRAPQPLNAIPAPVTPRILEEAKPVTEESEDETPEPFIPQLIAQQPSPQPQQQIFQEHNSIPQQDASFEEQQSPILLPRFPPVHERERERPNLQQSQRIPEFQSSSIGGNAGGNTAGQRFFPNEKIKVRARPSHRVDSEPLQAVRQSQNRPVTVNRPLPAPQLQPIQNSVRSEFKLRKPVSQIVRKYQEENEDGSITWGYENDDGSFKEETIGIDCVTRGSYGYVDPDGVKREYNYETGIQCDPNKRNQPDEEDTGFVDYEGNRAVLPNGVEINLAAMAKKKSKRPGAILQPQQQQFYRN